MTKRLACVLVVGMLCAATPVAAQSAGPAKVGSTAKGKVLTTPAGMTLYERDSDKNGKSSCNGQCAKNWPPFAPASDASPSGAWTIITRADGSKQWAYKGKPLYTWAKDKKPGDTSGDGVAKVWHVAKPNPA